MAQKTNDAVVAAILQQYETGNAKRTTVSKSFDLKNYFSTYLADGIKTGSKRIRILPGSDGGTPFKEMHVHSKQDSKGKWNKYTCLSKNFEKDCPFCEVGSELRSKDGSQAEKDANYKLAKSFNARKMYVLRVIDRDNESEGIKFWRFNHDYTNKGIFDKMLSIIRATGDVSNLQTGRDLIIDIIRDEKGNCVVSGIVHCDSTPTFETQEELKVFSEDKRTWGDVYSVKPYEYLEIVVKGGEPMWSKTKECWIDKLDETHNKVKQEDYNDDDTVITMGSDVKKTVIKTEKPIEPVFDDNVDDDLPF